MPGASSKARNPPTCRSCSSQSLSWSSISTPARHWASSFRQAAVIVSNGPAVEAARSATTTIPIVFVIGDDPVRRGLVTSLNRPGGNLTGLTFFANRLSAKRLEMLLELVPGARVVAVLIDPNFSSSADELREVEEAGHTIERKIVAVKAGNEREFEGAFTKIVQAGAG